MSVSYNAGYVTAYGAAVQGGYTGTYDEFCAQQAEYADNAAAVEEAVTSAETAATTATEQASAAATSATEAATSATEAAASAEEAQDIVDGTQGMVATVESSTTASQDYSTGEYLVYDSTLYEVIADIASGDTLEVDTNIEATTAGTELSELNTNLDALDADLKDGTETTADYHLGFYLDENGDLCQVDE